MFYWRESSNEVDFILERRGETIAIEVKSGRRTTNKGLPLFREQYSPRHAIVVGSGGIAIEDFLKMDLIKLWK